MAKKKAAKKNERNRSQNSSSSSNIPSSSAIIDKEESDDFPEDDDLSISENDISHITNFISTTNKSFKNNASLMIDTFKGRSVYGIGMTLITMYEKLGDDKLSKIKRLNIIYLISKLDEIEPQLRVTLQKTIKQKNVIAPPIENTRVFDFFLISVAKSDKEEDVLMANLVLNEHYNLIQSQTVTEFIGNFEKLSEKVDIGLIPEKKLPREKYFFLCDTVPVSTLAMAAERDLKDVEGCSKFIYDAIEPFSPTFLPQRMPLIREEFLYSQQFEDFIETEKLFSQDLPEGDMDITKELEDLFSELSEATSSFAILNVDLDEDELSDEEEDPAGPSEEEEVVLFKFFKMQNMTNKQSKCLHKMLMKYAVDRFSNNKIFITTMALWSDDNFVKYCIKTSTSVTALLIHIASTLNEDAFDRSIKLLSEGALVCRSLEIILLLVGIKKTELVSNEVTNERYRKISEFVRGIIHKTNISYREIQMITSVLRILVSDNMMLAKYFMRDIQEFAMKHTQNKDATELFKLTTQIVRLSEKKEEEEEEEEAEDQV